MYKFSHCTYQAILINHICGAVTIIMNMIKRSFKEQSIPTVISVFNVHILFAYQRIRNFMQYFNILVLRSTSQV